MSKLHELEKQGQAIWFDYIRRSVLTSGELRSLVDQGVRGVTSNPTIFENAIVGSSDYDRDIVCQMRSGRSIEQIYETLAFEDIRLAAETLRPVYDSTSGADGYVSLEVSPTLAHDTDRTIAEARRLFETLGKPNVMIKVPATAAGIPAVETLIADGINVNVTLIFSVRHYEAVAEAYIAGLEKRAAGGDDLAAVASVASFFVSRVDTAVDGLLNQKGAAHLAGRAAVANAKVAYARFTEIFAGPRWNKLAAKGARVQRPLWASTGTKDPAYPDTLYVDTLIGPHTVNTAPPKTIDAFLDHGKVAPTLEAGIDDERKFLAELARPGIDLEAVTQKLQDDGVAAFAKSFETLMSGIADKRERLSTGRQTMSTSLGSFEQPVKERLRTLTEQSVATRVWNRDYTVWNPEPTEITNRLGWLDSIETMSASLPEIATLVQDVRNAGYTHVLLLGMGGSSLAPEVFCRTFGVANGYLDLDVLDSTDPGAVIAHAERLDPARTLFIVSTKSGGTVETLSFFKYFYNRTVQSVGADAAGEHFIAITDPKSSLADRAGRHGFRTTFLNDPDIGGRYSALSYFGLVPAALIGVDLQTLLDRALLAAADCGLCEGNDDQDNRGLQLGAIIGELALQGRDKVTLIASPQIASFGDWVEQLIAESTGKENKGILPVVGEPPGPSDVYGDDRLFVHLHLSDDATHNDAVAALQSAGHPVVRVELTDPYDLGGQFFLWEMATAVAGAVIGINPFDQPDVEAAKVLAREMVAQYHTEGKLPPLTPTLTENGITVVSDRPGEFSADSPEAAIDALLRDAKPGTYVAIQAYIQSTPDTDTALETLRTDIRERYKLATTVGYGPRFLHSTGQLHKGDAGCGLFIQVVGDTPTDADIPDHAGKTESSMTFGVLKQAQSLGDRQALLDRGRRVLRLELGRDVNAGLNRLSESIRTCAGVEVAGA